MEISSILMLVISGLVITSLTILVIIKKNEAGVNLQSFNATKKTSSPVEKDFYIFQIKRYSNQQYWAFALLWVSITVSLILGSILIYKRFISDDSSFKWLPYGISLAGGSGISITAFRFYKIASSKLEVLMKKL